MLRKLLCQRPQQSANELRCVQSVQPRCTHNGQPRIYLGHTVRQFSQQQRVVITFDEALALQSLRKWVVTIRHPIFRARGSWCANSGNTSTCLTALAARGHRSSSLISRRPFLNAPWTVNNSVHSPPRTNSIDLHVQSVSGVLYSNIRDNNKNNFHTRDNRHLVAVLLCL